MATDIDLLITARAQALFASDLSAFSCHSQVSVMAAIRRAIRVHRGLRGCVAEVAAAYGDHPETAAARMRWARVVTEDALRLPSPPVQWRADVSEDATELVGVVTR